MSAKILDSAAAFIGWTPGNHGSLRETSWLDGLRGAAAMVVMVSHFSQWWLSAFFFAPFGAEVYNPVNVKTDIGINHFAKGQILWGLWRLPWIRAVCSPGAAVSTFFVLSGFVLSWGPLALVHGGEQEKLYGILGSSILRRWFRLFLPGTIVTIIPLIHRILVDPKREGPWTTFTYFITQTIDWFDPFPNTHTTPFTVYHDFNGVMWTLPFEFSGSIYIFVTLLALGRIQNFQRRATAVLAVSLYALYRLHWNFWLFGTGMTIADYVRQHGGFRQLSQSTSPQMRRLWFLGLIIGVFLVGHTSAAPYHTNPAYHSFLSVLPMPPEFRGKVGESQLFWGIGSILIMASGSHLAVIREFFERPALQYAGRVSFMLYLIHMPVSDAIGKPLRDLIYTTFCTWTIDETFDPPVIFVVSPAFYFGVYAFLMVVCVSITLAAANLLEIHVDRPCLQFAKTVDKWILGEVSMQVVEKGALPVVEKVENGVAMNGDGQHSPKLT